MTTAQPLPEVSAAKAAPGSVSHDNSPTAALAANMATGWGPSDDAGLLTPEPVAAYAEKRRAALSALFPGDTLVVATGNPKVRSNDTDYPFRAHSDYAWLTGDLEPDSVLVLLPEGDGHRAVVCVPERSDRSSTAFFTDRRYGELWVGPRRGPEEVSRVYAVEATGLTALPQLLEGADPARVRTLPGIDAALDELLADHLARDDAEEADGALARALAELKLVKDDFEIAQLEEAVAATVQGFVDVVRELPTARSHQRGERWLEGTFWRRSRLDGNDVGYGSIVACGHHATTLHWVRNDGEVRDGDLLLLDMGVEGRSLYTADVSRTLPVSGSFTAPQRRVYEAVHEAQRAALAVVHPGSLFSDVHAAAMRVLTTRLVEWGLLTGDVDDLLAQQLHRRWTLHGTSHHLGIDVHDCAAARDELYRQGTLEAGMVITVEPGLYFQRNDELAPEELRGIGVRIEDDVLVTADGVRVLSDALPTDADEVEAWTRELLS